MLEVRVFFRGPYLKISAIILNQMLLFYEVFLHKSVVKFHYIKNI